MRAIYRYAAMAAVVSSLCACAAGPTRATHPSAEQLAQLLPVTVTDVVSQKELQAQDTYTVANVRPVAVGNAAIVPVALGGALGMLIVNAAEKASAEKFASEHVLPVREALADYDASGTVRRSIGDAFAADPSVFASVSEATEAPAPGAAGRHAVALASYALTPDFSAIQVTLSLQILNGGKVPAYANEYVFQSPRITLSPKTAEDIGQAVEEESRRYEALHVNDQIIRANALGRSTEGARLRSVIMKEQNEHRLRLGSARLSSWDAEASARRLAALWSRDGGAAVKQALKESGPVLERMVAMDLLSPPLVGEIPTEGKQIASDAGRRVLMRPNGSLVSLSNADGFLDATPKLGPAVPVSVSGTR